jgi:hypothetical protein
MLLFIVYTICSLRSGTASPEHKQVEGGLPIVNRLSHVSGTHHTRPQGVHCHGNALQAELCKEAMGLNLSMGIVQV